MNKDEYEILEELLNDEIINYLDSGYKITDKYIVTLQSIIKKLGLKETQQYKYNRYKKRNNND